MNQDRLVAFSDMKNFKVSDEDPDVRGWTVVDGEGHSHGTVRDMLIDRDRLKVEYFTVEGDGNQTGVVDAGSARVDRDGRRLVIPDRTAVQQRDSTFASHTNNYSHQAATGMETERHRESD